MRLTQTERFYFCSVEHADAFRLPKGPTEDAPLAPPAQAPAPAVAPTPPQARGSEAPGSGVSDSKILAPGSSSALLPPQEAPKTPSWTPSPNARFPEAPAIAAPSQAPLAPDLGGTQKAPEEQAQVPHPAHPETTLTSERASEQTNRKLKEPFRFRPRVALAWAPVLLSLVATGLTAMSEEGDVWPPLASSLILGLSAFFGLQSVRSWELADEPERARIAERLGQKGHRITSSGTVEVYPEELRAGEEVRVHAGEYFPADGTITAGEGEAELWEGARNKAALMVGDRVVSGGLLISGSLQIACSKTGTDRALAPLIIDRGPRLAETVGTARFGRLLADQGALLFAVVASSLVWAQGGAYVHILGVFAASWGALSHPVARVLPTVCCRRWLLWASRQGICFAHGKLVDQAATVSSAAFCVRGTVLHGEPEVAEVHPLRDMSEGEVLALAAGAESVVHHPVAAAVLRAARTRHLEVDACRGHNTLRGMGVRCMSSSGDTLVLGSRELLLRERISIAMAEETLRGLESRGLTALMLAREGHLVGVLALQDSLRAGAKAAVQVLMDEGIEPVLISGDSRATTEAVAHALAVEHVRPEVAASGRAREVQSLIEGGASLAVIGTSPRDDAALGAAPVPVVLHGASVSWRDSKSGKERAIGLIGKQVIAAPLALLTAKRIRSIGARALLLSFLPAAAAAAGSTSLLAPIYVAPLLGALGTFFAARISLSAGGPFKGLTQD